MPTPWKPAVQLDLNSTSATAFQDAIAQFWEWDKVAPPVGPLALANGWYDITPEIAEDLLRRNARNRKVGLATVIKYYHAMRLSEWKRTGQAVLINMDGKLEDGQHRLWAGYLSQVTFPSYIVADVPVFADLFAYLDDSKPRSPADALYTSGSNGMSGTIAAAIKLAWRYDNKAIQIIKQPRIRDMTNIEILDYSRSNPQLAEAAHVLIGTYGRAAKIIKHKGVAAFFLWKALTHHDAVKVDAFMTSLGSGALLPEDSPILALRARLNNEQDQNSDSLHAPRRLALVIKAFSMYCNNGKIGKRGLSLGDNDPFPRLEASQLLEQAA